VRRLEKRPCVRRALAAAGPPPEVVSGGCSPVLLKTGAARFFGRAAVEGFAENGLTATKDASVDSGLAGQYRRRRG